MEGKGEFQRAGSISVICESGTSLVSSLVELEKLGMNNKEDFCINDTHEQDPIEKGARYN